MPGLCASLGCCALSDRRSLRRWQASDRSASRRYWHVAMWQCGKRARGWPRARGWRVESEDARGSARMSSFLHAFVRMYSMLCKGAGVPMSSLWRRDWPLSSRGGAGACSMLAAGRCVFCHATAYCGVVCVVSVVFKNILSARVVLSPVVAIIVSSCRNEVSQRDGALC
jgi:hypothetical protein